MDMGKNLKRKKILKTFILIISSVFFFNPTCSSQDWNKFTCDGTGKCSGLKFSLNYPKNWKVHEGTRPHIINNFEFEEKRGLIQMSLYVRKLDYIPSDEQINETYNKESFMDNFDAVQILEFNNKAKIDMEKCITATMFAKMAVYDKEIISLVKPSMVFYDKYIIQVNFFILSNDQNRETMRDMLNKYNPIFNEIMYSLALLSKWENIN
jgi:hypothetical protein